VGCKVFGRGWSAGPSEDTVSCSNGPFYPLSEVANSSVCSLLHSLVKPYTSHNNFPCLFLDPSEIKCGLKNGGTKFEKGVKK